MARSCSISSDGAEALRLGRELPAAPGLVRLDVCWNSVGAGAESLLSGATRLETLDLGTNVLDRSGVAALSRGLARTPSLTSLRLSDVELGGGGAQLLAASLSRIKISKLSLNRPRADLLGPDGAKQLCTIVGQLPALTGLVVNHQRLGPEGVGALAAELGRATPRLELLFLTSNEAGDAGAEAVAAALAGLPRLRTLDMGDNGIGDAGATRLADAVLRSSRLETLYLSGNPFTAAGAERLAAAQTATGRPDYLSLGYAPRPAAAER